MTVRDIYKLAAALIGDAGNNLYTLLDGSGSESVTIPANATSFKVAFRSKYGVWWSSSISLS